MPMVLSSFPSAQELGQVSLTLRRRPSGAALLAWQAVGRE